MIFFKVGTDVVYDVYGVCCVKEIKSMSFVAGKKEEQYYVLTPVNGSTSTYYVPATNEKALSKLRYPLTVQQINDILDESRECSFLWTENRQRRTEEYRNILDGGISPRLIALIRCLYEKKEELSEKGKSLAATEEVTLSGAEKLLGEEFAYTLNIEKSQVSGYIHDYFTGKA